MLPQKLQWPQAETEWARQINPVINSPLLQGQLLTNQALINGTTILNHGLQRKLVGWIIVGISGAATIYDNQATNTRPELTLSLTSNAAVTCSLWVF